MVNIDRVPDSRYSTVEHIREQYNIFNTFTAVKDMVLLIIIPRT